MPMAGGSIGMRSSVTLRHAFGVSTLNAFSRLGGVPRVTDWMERPFVAETNLNTCEKLDGVGFCQRTLKAAGQRRRASWIYLSKGISIVVS